MQTLRMALLCALLALASGCTPLRQQFDATDAVRVPPEVLEQPVSWMKEHSRVQCEAGKAVYVVGEYACDTGEARGVLRVQ